MPAYPEDLQELERELYALRPRALSRGCTAGVAASLGAASAQPMAAVRTRLRWIAWPVAAAFVAGCAWLAIPRAANRASSLPATRPSSEPAGVFRPVATEAILYSAQLEGLVVLPNGSPARQLRNRYVDTIVWRNADTNASFQWTLPRDEVRWVPVNAY